MPTSKTVILKEADQSGKCLTHQMPTLLSLQFLRLLSRSVPGFGPDALSQLLQLFFRTFTSSNCNSSDVLRDPMGFM